MIQYIPYKYLYLEYVSVAYRSYTEAGCVDFPASVAAVPYGRHRYRAVYGSVVM